MDFKTIKNIDFWAGRFICRVFTLFSRFYRMFIPYKYVAPQKIVFIKLIEQGATVLAYSAIERAITGVGKANVYFLVFKENRPILDIINVIPAENIIEIDHHSFVSFFTTAAKALFKIRRLKIDSTADMEFFSRAAAIIAYMCGARNRAGLHRYNSEQPYRGDLMTHKIQYNPYLHCSLSYYLLVESLFSPPTGIPLLKIPVDERKIENPVFKADANIVDQLKSTLMQTAKIPFSKIVLLNPNASDMLPLRKWHTPNFVQLAKNILQHSSDTIIVFTGAKGEVAPADALCEEINSDRIVNMAGKTSLVELMHLYAMSNLLVTNDSGPAHFASMTDVNIVVLFGPETPQLFAPLSKRTHVIWKKLACSPCVNVFNHRLSPCNNNVCMQSISVAEVFEKVKLCI